MKTISTNVNEALINGLCPLDNPSHNAPFLSDCHNLKPTPMGGVEPKKVTWPFNSAEPSSTFPFPHFARAENKTLLCESTSMEIVNETAWTKSSLTFKDSETGNAATLTGGGYWQSAGMQDVIILCNGSELVFDLPSNSQFGSVLQRANPSVLSATALCNYNDRLVITGLSGSWFSGSRWTSLFTHFRNTTKNELFVHEDMGWSTRWVVIFEPRGGATDIPYYTALTMLGAFGNTKFDAQKELIYQYIDERKLTMRPMRTPHPAIAMRQAGDRIALLSQSECLEFVQNAESPHFYDEQLAPYGVIGRTAVGGSGGAYLFVSPGGYLNLRVVGSGMDRLMFRSHTTNLGAGTVVTYDPGEGDYFLSDGTRTYVLTVERKLGKSDQKPTSMFRTGTGLVGVPKRPSGTRQMRFTTVPLDMNERGSKRVVTLQSTTKNLTVQKARMDWRVSSLGNFNAGALVPFTDYGVAHPGQSGIDMQLYWEANISSANEDGAIYKMEVQYHGNDYRARRGTRSAAGFTGEE